MLLGYWGKILEKTRKLILLVSRESLEFYWQALLRKVDDFGSNKERNKFVSHS